jgi:hypothetical protein
VIMSARGASIDARRADRGERGEDEKGYHNTGGGGGGGGEEKEEEEEEEESGEGESTSRACL